MWSLTDRGLADLSLQPVAVAAAGSYTAGYESSHQDRHGAVVATSESIL